MPNYEFYCSRCKKLFSALMSVREHDEKAAECPECRQTSEVVKCLASVHVVTSKKS